MAEGDVFSTTNLKVSNLVSEVDSGIIALPDLQRPFVWKDKQIRDLFDSLYRGLPTGLIILWGIGGRDDEFKPIGFDKPTSPNRLVIDGQQRLTSLYTVFTGKPVLDKNYNFSCKYKSSDNISPAASVYMLDPYVRVEFQEKSRASDLDMCEYQGNIELGGEEYEVYRHSHPDYDTQPLFEDF